MEYDEFSEVNIPDLPEEFSYAMAQQQVQQDIIKGWTTLKNILETQDLDDNVKKQIEEFNKLLQYWL